VAQDPPGLEGLTYSEPFFPGSRYDASIPTPESLLGFPAGQLAATPQQIADAVVAWNEASDRTKLVEYARTWENRPLYYIVISSPDNIARLDEIRGEMQRLADPRGLADGEGARLVKELPAVAWMAYSIHGNETSGGDAALALIYHLVASTDDDVRAMLDEMVIIVDPAMNPDGRHRFGNQATEDRGAFPNVDDQALLHSGFWPYGRTNHYFFDLNRDWILGINPESRGRIKAAGEWHPLYFLDAHEMGPQDTFLFSPAREPINAHFPESTRKWKDVFARRKAVDLDRKEWLYYTGEWNDNWYPGYSDAWAQMRGSIGFLYEQARVAEDGVRRADRTILSYRESVHHQLLSSWSDLKSLQENAGQIKTDFLALRRSVVGEKSPYANRTFAILPTKNESRIEQLLDLLDLQGIEVYRADREIAVKGAVDQLGRTGTVTTLPAGAILIPNRQPEANLVAAMLEFDPRMSDVALTAERKQLLAKGQSTMYDATAWNLTMMYGLEAVTVPSDLPAGTTRVGRTEKDPEAPPDGEAVAYAFDGADDASVAAAARLMQRKVQVRVAGKAFELGEAKLSRGSVVVTRVDNRHFDGDLAKAVAEVAAELGIRTHTVTTGWGEGDLPDLGGEHFVHVYEPRVATLSRGPFSSYDVGTIWYTLDQKIGIRSSRIDSKFLGRADLRRYNVVVIPNKYLGTFDKNALDALGKWVESGGTLIAIGSAAAELTKKEDGLSVVRQLPDVLDELDPYRVTVMREWMASREISPNASQIWSHAVDSSMNYPWTPAEGKKKDSADKAELERRDEWQSLFMPQGAFVAARVDQEHWLTFGTGEVLPILYGDEPVLMSKAGSEAPIRLGVYEPAKAATVSDSVPMAGWSILPENQRLLLRMSGLLWPEAAHRISSSAWLTRERKGRGQIILMAGSPAFRGTTLGTMRVLANALVYGPGFGAQQVVEP
jgi:hypothetical protein